MSEPEVKRKREPRGPLISGHCATPSTKNPEGSHARCTGGRAANPDKEWQPCPCRCHLGETYECGNCGRDIREAPAWDPMAEDMIYVHVDKSGRAVGEECP